MIKPRRDDMVSWYETYVRSFNKSIYNFKESKGVERIDLASKVISASPLDSYYRKILKKNRTLGHKIL
jgi:hypothetical protein